MVDDDRNCALCGASANFRCQRCLESYCSSNCQFIDWPKHKLVCIPIPLLIPKDTVKVVNRKTIHNSSGTLECVETNIQNKTENLKQSNFQNRLLRDNVDSMRRPRSKPIETIDQFHSNESNMAIAVPINDNILNQIDSIYVYPRTSNTTFNDENLINISCPKISMGFLKNNNDGPINQDHFRNRNNLNSINVNKPNINERLNKCREIQKIEHNKLEVLPPKLVENPGFKKDDGTINNNTSVSLKPVMPKRPIINKSRELKDNNQINKSIETIKTVKPWKIPFPFPNDKIDFNVTVQFVDQIAKLIWVTDTSLYSHALNLLKEINTNIQDAIKATVNDIDIDNLLAAPFTDGYYYRAIVLEKINSQNQVRVRLVDFGNDYQVHINELKLPSAIMKNLNAYAFCCRYNESTEIGKILNIRIKGKESNEIFIIEEIKENMPQLANESILKLLPNSIDIIIKNIFNEKSKGFAVVLDNNSKFELDKLNEILISEKTFQYDIVTKLKNGDLVAGRKNEWKRSIIIDQCNNKYLVFFIDYGEIEIVDQIKMLPKSFLKIPPLSVLIDINRISIDEESFNIQYFCNLKTIKIKKTGKITLELSVDCNLYDENNTKLAEITLNHFNGDLRNIQYLKGWKVPLLSGDIVHITHVVDHFNIYIALNSFYQCYSNTFEENYNLMILKNGKTPERNDIVLVNNNNQYQRCCVIEKINECIYHVQNIDTGYEFNINSDKIKMANDFIKYIPVYTIKCSLDIINILEPKDLINNKAIHALKSYCTIQQEFILKINNKNVVELFFNDKNKNSMNKQLIPMLYESVNSDDHSNLIAKTCVREPTPENLEISQEIDSLYQFKEIKIIPIPTGKNVKVLILDTSTLKHGTVTASVCDLTFIGKYYSEYQPKLNEYCSSNADFSPQENELCFTIYEDGNWYRALCIQSMPNDKFNLKCIDFGNCEIANKAKIRKFHKDFLFPCLANKCLVHGLPSPLTDEQQESLTKIFHPCGAITVDNVEMVNDTYVIKIEGIEKMF